MIAEQAQASLEERASLLTAAHIRAGGATVHIVRSSASTVDAHLAEARSLATAWSARGVVWIQSEASDRLLVYLVSSEKERTFRREIPIAGEQTAVVLETVANVAASSAIDLIEGRVSEMDPVDEATIASVPAEAQPAEAAIPTPAPAPSEPAPPPFAASRESSMPDRSPVRIRSSANERFVLSAGYSGGTFAKSVPWQNMISLSAAWAPIPNLLVGVGYDIVPVQRLREDVALDLGRHPFHLSTTYRMDFARGFGSLNVGARLTFDAVMRSATAPSTPTLGQFASLVPPDGLGRSSQTTNVLVSFAPTAGLLFRLTDQLGIALWGGLDVPLNQLSQAGIPLMNMEVAPVRIVSGVGLQLALPGSGASGNTKAATGMSRSQKE